METFLIALGILCAVGGVLGSILPVLPSPILAYSSLFFLYFAREGSVSDYALIIGGIFAVTIFILSYFIPVAIVKISGASKAGLYGAFIGAVLGALVFPPFGIFFGAMFGAVFGELYAVGDIRKATTAGLCVVLGSLLVLFIETVFSVSIFIYFLIKLF